MFTDARSRKIVFVAHRVLNQNAISDGTADFPGCDAGLVRQLLQSGVDMIGVKASQPEQAQQRLEVLLRGA